MTGPRRFPVKTTRPRQNDSRKPSTDMAFALIYRVSLCAHMVPGGARYGGGSRACGAHCLHWYGAQETSEQGCARNTRSLHDDWSLICVRMCFSHLFPPSSLSIVPLSQMSNIIFGSFSHCPVMGPRFNISCRFETDFVHWTLNDSSHTQRTLSPLVLSPPLRSSSTASPRAGPRLFLFLFWFFFGCWVLCTDFL